MKKYLMTGLTAFAMSGLFTSCTHEMNNYVGDTTQEIKKNYEDAFVETFGPVNENQDWGFGTSSAASTRAGSRAITGIEFPTFKDGDCPSMPTKYKNTLTEAIAAGAKYAKDYQNYQKGDIIYIDSEYQSLNNPQNTEDLTIYVDGEVTYCGQTNQNGNGTTICVTEGSTLKLGQVSERLTIYLAPNATLDIRKGLKENVINWWPYESEIVESGNNTFTFTKDNAALYMSDDSQVLGGILYFKDGYTVLNEGGTIETAELHVENGATLYNKSDVTATGVIALRNTLGEIDNFGTMEGASMTLDANARFYNVAGGEVNISGLTKINNDSGSNAWQNGGKFNTGSFEITGGCQDPAAFNNCHMSVTNKFFMNHGNFVLDGGAAVECGSFEWQSDNFFHMGGKALLKVSGQMLMNNQNSSPNYGFWGDDSEYAVIQAGSVEKGSEGKYRAAYYGNLFIDTENHFAQGRSSADGPWYYFDPTVKFSFNDKGGDDEGAKKATDFSITIPADAAGCTPGYSYGEKIEKIRIIAEDLTVTYNNKESDFDFNDVVFDVIWNKTQSKVSIEVLADGAELTMYIGGTAAGVGDRMNVNEMFSEANGTTIPKNTYPNTAAGAHKAYKTYKFDLNSDEWSGTDIGSIAKSIYVRVMKSELVTLDADQGKAAGKIAVGTDYDWCNERDKIYEIYPKFPSYVGGTVGNFQWYK